MDPDILHKSNNNTIKTSNHNVLISVYKKEPSISSIKTESIPNINPNSNKNIIKVRNNNMNKNKSNEINYNNTISKNINHSNHNSKRILSNRINTQKSKSNLQDKKLFSDHKTNRKENNEGKDKNNIEFIEIKFGKKNENDKLIPNYRKNKNCASYSNINNNSEINIGKKDNNKIKDNEIKKPEITTQKIINHNTDYVHNFSSTSNISSLNNTDNIKNIGNNYCTTTERNNNKRKLINFRKIKKKDNILNDDMSVNSPSTYLLSPNNNTSKIRRKMTYRSKRATNKNLTDEKESIINNNKDNTKDNNNIYKDNNIIDNKNNNLYKENKSNIDNKINNNLSKDINVNITNKNKNNDDLNDNKDNKDNDFIKVNNDNNNDDNISKDNKDDNDNDNKDNLSNKNIKKRKYLIKVAKTPNESNTHKNKDNDIKTEDINCKRKKMRHFLYFKGNKEKEKKENLENKENKENKEEKKEIEEKDLNLFTPKNNIIPTTIAKSEIISSSPSFKKINNKIYKISPKQSFKDLLHEANQNKNIQDSFSNIFLSCKSEIKNNQSNTVKSIDMNNSFSCFSNELELNLDNKNLLFNYINGSNNINSSNNLCNSNINTYKNISATRNKNSNHKANSPNNIVYKKKMNLIKSISNHYKKNIGILSPKYLLNSNSSTQRKYNNSEENPDKIIKNEKNQCEYANSISNNIINNNTYNTTLNIFKMNDISLKDIKNSKDIVVTKVNKNKNNEESIEIIKKQPKQIIWIKNI